VNWEKKSQTLGKFFRTSEKVIVVVEKPQNREKYEL
jgi:hypothetical protein